VVVVVVHHYKLSQIKFNKKKIKRKMYLLSHTDESPQLVGVGSVGRLSLENGWWVVKTAVHRKNG
jgi:hypothetical protein